MKRRDGGGDRPELCLCLCLRLCLCLCLCWEGALGMLNAPPKNQVKTVAPDERAYSVFVGAAILASLTTFQQVTHTCARTHTHIHKGDSKALTILLRIYLSSSEKERVGERWREGRPQVWERGGRRWADMTGSTRRCGSGPTSTRMLAKSSYTESASSLVYWSVLCTSTKSVYLMHSNIVTTRKSWYRRLLPGIYSQFHVPSSRTSDGHVRCFANPRE